jgi:hypothetical protein
VEVVEGWYLRKGIPEGGENFPEGEGVHLLHKEERESLGQRISEVFPFE